MIREIRMSDITFILVVQSAFILTVQNTLILAFQNACSTFVPFPHAPFPLNPDHAPYSIVCAGIR